MARAPREIRRPVMHRTEPYITAATQRCREQYRLDPGAPPRAEHIGGAALRVRTHDVLLKHLRIRVVDDQRQALRTVGYAAPV